MQDVQLHNISRRNRLLLSTALFTKKGRGVIAHAHKQAQVPNEFAPDKFREELFKQKLTTALFTVAAQENPEYKRLNDLYETALVLQLNLPGTLTYNDTSVAKFAEHYKNYTEAREGLNVVYKSDVVPTVTFLKDQEIRETAMNGAVVFAPASESTADSAVLFEKMFPLVDVRNELLTLHRARVEVINNLAQQLGIDAKGLGVTKKIWHYTSDADRLKLNMGII